MQEFGPLIGTRCKKQATSATEREGIEQSNCKTTLCLLYPLADRPCADLRAGQGFGCGNGETLRGR